MHQRKNEWNFSALFSVRAPVENVKRLFLADDSVMNIVLFPLKHFFIVGTICNMH